MKKISSFIIISYFMLSNHIYGSEKNDELLPTTPPTFPTKNPHYKDLKTNDDAIIKRIKESIKEAKKPSYGNIEYIDHEREIIRYSEDK